MKTRNKFKFNGKFKHIRGEDLAEYTVSLVDTNYTKVALEYLLCMYNYRPSQATKVINFLVENCACYNNVIPVTIDKISEITGVSRPTIIDTLKALEEMGYITRKTGMIFVNPDILWVGNADKRHKFVVAFKNGIG